MVSKLLMETKNEEIQNSITPDHDNIFYVKNEPVMQSAINVLELLGKHKEMIIKAKGLSIPNAVAIANIITEKMLKGNSEISSIRLDSEVPETMGKMISTVEIKIGKK